MVVRTKPEPERPLEDVLHEPSGGPERESLWNDVWDRRRLVAGVAIVLMLVGAVVGVLRDPTYTSSSRLNVGRINVGTQSVPGWVEGAKSLAASYSRAITAQPVVESVRKQTGLSAAAIDARVTASPVPDSSVFIVEAKGPSDAKAIELANTTSQALTEYVTNLNRQNPDAGRLLFRFRQASLKVRRLVRDRLALRQRVPQGGFPPPEIRSRLERIEADLEAAQLQQDNLRALYEESQRGQASTDTVQILAPATKATSDRRSTFQRLVFVGLVAGTIIGIVLVALLRRGPRRRDLTA